MPISSRREPRTRDVWPSEILWLLAPNIGCPPRLRGPCHGKRDRDELDLVSWNRTPSTNPVRTRLRWREMDSNLRFGAR